MGPVSVFIFVIIDQCNASLKNVYSNYFASTCVVTSDTTCMVTIASSYKGVPFLKCDQCPPGQYSHIDRCVSQCPPNYYIHNNKYCACAGVANLTINDKCYNQIACPINMYFDFPSHSCLSCPFGCISCINSQCTACNPGYFLYISPQSILCRRKSPFFPCDQQYSWQRNSTCMITNYNDPNLMMTICYAKVPNCQICIPQSD